MGKYSEKIQENNRCKRKFRDSLMNYVMTMLPMEHEKTITLFAERALLEAYQNGKKDGSLTPTAHTEVRKRH